MQRDYQKRVLQLPEISAACYFKRCDKCGHFYQTVGEAGQAVTHSLLLLQLRTVKGAWVFGQTAWTTLQFESPDTFAAKHTPYVGPWWEIY